VTRRFRLDSATAGDIEEACCCWFLMYDFELRVRARRLLLHWWAIGHDPARALRCPECDGIGSVLEDDTCDCGGRHDVPCPDCNGRGTR
jgi:hypothetical protein